MKKTILLGIVAITIALTSSTALAGDVGIRVNIGFPLPRLVLPPPPRLIVVAPPVISYPAPGYRHCAPPVVYHRCDHRCHHGHGHHHRDNRHHRYHHHHGHGHRGH